MGSVLEEEEGGSPPPDHQVPGEGVREERKQQAPGQGGVPKEGEETEEGEAAKGDPFEAPPRFYGVRRQGGKRSQGRGHRKEDEGHQGLEGTNELV